VCVCRRVLCKEQGELSDLIDEDVEPELVPSVPSLPLATLLYSPSNTLAAELSDVSPLSAAVARHMGINLTPDGIAARNRRGVAIIIHGAPLSGTQPSLSLSDVSHTLSFVYSAFFLELLQLECGPKGNLLGCLEFLQAECHSCQLCKSTERNSKQWLKPRIKHDAVGDGRLRPRCRHLAITAKQRCLTSAWCCCLANWLRRAVFDSGLIPALYENIVSFTKPEVHNVSCFRQRRTESWPHVTCTENLVKFGRVVFETCNRTDRQTSRHTDTLMTILCSRPGGEIITHSLASLFLHLWADFWGLGCHCLCEFVSQCIISWWVIIVSWRCVLQSR